MEEEVKRVVMGEDGRIMISDLNTSKRNKKSKSQAVENIDDITVRNIRLKLSTWKMMTHMKATFNLPSYNAVIRFLFKFIQNKDLGKDLEDFRRNEFMHRRVRRV